MTRRRDLLILVALFLVLALFTILGPGNSDEEQPFGGTTTYSSAPGGTLALLRWTQQLGYDAQRLAYTEFALDSSTSALFIINPSVRIERAAAIEVLDWVAAGGTLVLVDDPSGGFGPQNELLNQIDLELERYEGTAEDSDTLVQGRVLQPAFNDPPLRAVPLRTDHVLSSERADLAPLLGVDDNTAMVGLTHGAGYIYVSSASFPFTNEGLRDKQSAGMVLNLLRRVAPGERILFDEYHHGFFTPPSLRTIVLGNAWGWALIYTLAILGCYLVLTGRRFGQPVPLREETARRSSAEYIESMADMLQRGNKRAFIQQHYHSILKRRLARPYGINPALDDAAFLEELARYRDDDHAALRGLLERLRRPGISEAELLRAVSEAHSYQAGRQRQ